MHALIIFIVISVIILIVYFAFTLSVQTGESAAGPWITGGESKYNNQYGDHYVRIQIRFSDDCWEEVYARAVPKGANYKGLNWDTFYNNDEPDNGRSEIINAQWKFKGSTVQEYSKEGRIRVYAEIEFPDGSYGPTVNQYKSFNAADKYFYFYFNLQTRPELCN
jgi:hypothetical protein